MLQDAHDEEDYLDWGVLDKMDKGSYGFPIPAHSKVLEKIRERTPQQVLCALFCGGRGCKVEGQLHSTWMTNRVMAMCRPQSPLASFLELMDMNEIKTVINLTEEGEHAYCGTTLPSDRPTATDLMAHSIYSYNFQCRDHHSLAPALLLDIVKVLTFSMQEGKVGVHCHAGLGRTGQVIACYLIYQFQMSAQSAILYVRLKRPNSIQSRSQILSVFQFDSYLSGGMNSFASLSAFLIHQQKLLHGYPARNLRHLPRVILSVTQTILNIVRPDRMISTRNSINADAPLTRSFFSSPHNHQMNCPPRLLPISQPKPILKKMIHDDVNEKSAKMHTRKTKQSRLLTFIFGSLISEYREYDLEYQRSLIEWQFKLMRGMRDENEWNRLESECSLDIVRSQKSIFIRLRFLLFLTVNRSFMVILCATTRAVIR